MKPTETIEQLALRLDQYNAGDEFQRDIEEAVKILSELAKQEPVCTKIEGNQFDTFKVDFEDSKKLKAIPVGANLYLGPAIFQPAAVPGGFAEVMVAVFRELEHREDNRGNAPGHGHKVPGVWDSDNGALAGQPCAWCALWNKAKAMLSAAPVPQSQEAKDAVANDADMAKAVLDYMARTGTTRIVWGNMAVLAQTENCGPSNSERYLFALENGWPQPMTQFHPTVEPTTWGYGDGPRFNTPTEAIDAAMSASKEASDDR